MEVSFRLAVLKVLVACALVDGAKFVLTQLSDDEITALLQRHNDFRRQTVPSGSNIRLLTWDDRLAERAQEYSDVCKFAHSQKSLLEPYGHIGENIYITNRAPTGTEDIAQSVNAWFEEHRDYDFATNVCAQSKMCGHYTQTVWDKTYKVGCGKTKCNGTIKVGARTYQRPTLVVCKYGPSGNVRPLFAPKARRPFQEGEWCSACPEEAPVCVDRLCDVTKPPNSTAETNIEVLTTAGLLVPDPRFYRTATPRKMLTQATVAVENALQQQATYPAILRCYACEGLSSANECKTPSRITSCNPGALQAKPASDSGKVEWSCARFVEENAVKMNCIETKKCEPLGAANVANLTCCNEDLCNRSGKPSWNVFTMTLAVMLTARIPLTQSC